jgi:hypothetical protein
MRLGVFGELTEKTVYGGIKLFGGFGYLRGLRAKEREALAASARFKEEKGQHTTCNNQQSDAQGVRLPA